MIELGRSLAIERADSEIAYPRVEIFPQGSVVERVSQRLAGSLSPIHVMCHSSLGIGETISYSEALVGEGFTVVPHLTAREIKDEDTLAGIMSRFHGLGIDEIVVVRGDGHPKGEYGTVTQLMEGLRDMDVELREIGIGGYPEGRKNVSTDQLLESILARKIIANEMGVEQFNIFTQICFDPKAILSYAADIRAVVDARVIVGVPVHKSIQELYDMAVILKVGDSKERLSQEDPNAPYIPDSLSKAVLAGNADGNVSGLIVYSFNQTGLVTDLFSR